MPKKGNPPKIFSIQGFTEDSPVKVLYNFTVKLNVILQELTMNKKKKLTSTGYLLRHGGGSNSNAGVFIIIARNKLFQ